MGGAQLQKIDIGHLIAAWIGVLILTGLVTSGVSI